MENTESRVMSFDEFVKHENEMSGGMTDEPMTEPAETEIGEPVETEDELEMEEPANPEAEVQVEEPTN